MHMTANVNELGRERIDRRRLAFYLLATPLFLAVFMFLPAGNWLWPRGWLLIVVFYAGVAASTFYLRRANPDILAARINRHQGTEPWDKILLGLLAGAWIVTLPIAALDDAGFQWFPVPDWVCVLGYLLLLGGLAMLTWAQAVNKFFEPTVRIQADRGQQVIDRGPYAWVRHPGYAGGVPFLVGLPLALGSLWALIPAALSLLVLMLRTKWEDEMLQVKLPGYRDYAQRVRYRLMPGVW
jgi:protein-S-isoprenylcysteine O-methyltransferase Ste14